MVEGSAAQEAAQAVAAGPLSASNWLALAQALCNQGDLGDSAHAARQAHALDPLDPKPLVVLGGVLQSFGKWDEAVTHLDRALQIAPAYPPARWNRAHALMALGKWREGFADYEAGKAIGHRQVRTPGKEWRGEDGGTLLVWAEQGLGDAVQHLRWLARLEHRPGRILLEAHRPLVRWCQLNFPWLEVYAKPPEGWEPFPYDFEVSLSSLPHVLGVDEVSGAPYMTVDEPQESGKTGLCWRGSPDNPRDPLRSLPPEAVAVFEGAAEFVSLQHDADPPFAMQTSPVGDFLQLARVVAGCREVVTVDTAVVHVAGALGVPTKLVAPLDPEWRWGVSGPTTPWYDAVTVYRPSDYDLDFTATAKAVGATLTPPEPPTQSDGLRLHRLAAPCRRLRPHHEREHDADPQLVG